ncbi:MAG TPA: ABC transporter permease [Pseudonocardia sp.]|nr:ABC transporter permease [Pseudonocardia sp.]
MSSLLHDAFRWMWANKLRTILTLLIIGCTALITTAATGLYLGLQTAYRTQLSSDMNFIQVLRDYPRGVQGDLYNGEPLWDSDLTALRQQHDPTLTSEFIPVVSGTAWVRLGPAKEQGGVLGSTPSYLEYANDTLKAGSNIDWQQYDSGARVAVLGTDLVNELYADPSAAVGSTIFVGRIAFKVIGVQSDGGNVVVPLKAARGALLGGMRALTKIGVRLVSPDTKKAATDDLNTILYAQRRLTDGDSTHKDFNVDDGDFTWKRWGPLMQLGLWATVAVAGLPLLLGILGLTNALLSAGRERAAEINHRRRTGVGRAACFGHVLAESLTIAGVAGATGTALGAGLIWLGRLQLPALYPDTPVLPVLSAGPVVLGIGVSLLIGLLAGLYPALRAARPGPTWLRRGTAHTPAHATFAPDYARISGDNFMKAFR